MPSTHESPVGILLRNGRGGFRAHAGEDMKTGMDGLIGYTGFVGTTLMRQHGFDRRFNSRNIDDAAGAMFDTLVCAAAPGSMFEANRFPERDAARIDALIAQLDAIAGARRFVLISTIAVLAGFTAEDESTAAFEASTPYGVNRRRLEQFVEQRFPDALIVRLPALFGTGLKKNFLFDLMNPLPTMVPQEGLDQLKDAAGPELSGTLASLYTPDPQLGAQVIGRARLDLSGKRRELEAIVSEAGLGALRFTNPASRFQFYDMTALWRDIGLGLDNGLSVLHLAPPPIAAGNIHQALVGRPMPETGARLHTEDMRTRHAALWGQEGPYISTASTVIESLRAFVASERVPA